ncbi:MAG: hypothetical protein RL701_5832 [Pseudomonadota bacterium]
MQQVMRLVEERCAPRSDHRKSWLGNAARGGALIALVLSACSSDSNDLPYTAAGTGGTGTGISPITGAAGTSTGAAGKAGPESAAAGSGVAGSTSSVAGSSGGAAGAAVGGTAGGAAGAAAGGTGGAAAGGGSATFTAVLQIFSARNCGLCHSGGATTLPSSANGGLLFSLSDKAAAHIALVGPMTSSFGKCAGKTLVVPGSPDTSVLFDKLANATPACGATRMPLGGMPLTAAELESVRAWIADGAKNN